jgi:hypothetical protein
MDAPRGRIVIYCGAAGTVVVIGFVKSNSEV